MTTRYLHTRPERGCSGPLHGTTSDTPTSPNPRAGQAYGDSKSIVLGTSSDRAEVKGACEYSRRSATADDREVSKTPSGPFPVAKVVGPL